MEKKNKKTVKVTKWTIQNFPNMKSLRLVGVVGEGHEYIPAGRKIISSDIVEVKENTVETRNTIYELVGEQLGFENE